MKYAAILLIALGIAACDTDPTPAITSAAPLKCEHECQRGCEPPEVCASLTKEQFQ